MKHTTESIIEALKAGAWAFEIKLMEIAADRLEELQKECDETRAEVETRKEALIDAVEQIEGMRTLKDRWYDRAKKYEKERDEALIAAAKEGK
jgi:hypothetical protein